LTDFQYLVREANGTQRSGQETADSSAELIRSLRQQGLLVLEVKEIRAKVSVARSWSLNPLDYRPLQSVDVERAFHQIAVLLRSGIPLLESLEFVRDFARIGTRRVWQNLVERIAAGESLSDAMQIYPIFRNLTLQLVRVGEQSGRLDYALEQASVAMERSRVNRKQVLSALQYPVFMILFTIGIVAFMMAKLIPELKKFLAVMGRKLPPITQALIDVSHWFEMYTLNLLISIGVILMTLILLYQWPTTRLLMDRALLSLPIFGKLFRLFGTVTLAQGLGMMLRSGVRILEAMETMETLVGNRYLSKRIAYARERIAQGSSLADPLAEHEVFMPMLPRMIRVGEKSGTLDNILEETGRYHEEELQRTIRWMSSLIGPTMTVVVGGIIGFVYAAFLVAMFSAGAGPQK
jgi:type IV pilus assembly protein PilC